MKALMAVSATEWSTVQELRLRAGQAVTLSTVAGDRYLGRRGLSSVVQSDTFTCSPTQLEQCFLRLCEESVYAHEWELCQGYLAVAGGIRVGVAGTAVMQTGRISSVRDVTALCLRFPRHIPGCAAPLLARMLASGHPVNTLVVGPPSAGKTTLLRDAAVSLAARGYRVTVVDERGELSGPCPMTGCEVLLGYPKREGVRQAVRCLAPDVIVFDELGDEEEAAAVAACAHAGVAVVASLHGYDPASLSLQPLTRLLAQRRAFALWAFMAGRRTPGQVEAYLQPEVKGDALDWVSADGAGGHGPGPVWGSPTAPSYTVPAAGGAGAPGTGLPSALYGPAYGSAMAAVGGSAGL